MRQVSEHAKGQHQKQHPEHHRWLDKSPWQPATAGGRQDQRNEQKSEDHGPDGDQGVKVERRNNVTVKQRMKSSR